MAKPECLVEGKSGIRYTCGRCGHQATDLTIDEAMALTAEHRDSCPARPHAACPTCSCDPSALLVDRLMGDVRARFGETAPDRAAALREVEALLRRIHDVTEEANDVVRFYLAGDGAFLRDTANVTAGDLAGQIVDRVLGAELDGGAASS